jgi:hypothetical protein
VVKVLTNFTLYWKNTRSLEYGKWIINTLGDINSLSFGYSEHFIISKEEYQLVEEGITMDLDGDGLIGRYTLGNIPSRSPTMQPCWARRDDTSVSARTPRYARINSDSACLLNSAIPRDAVILSFNDNSFPITSLSSVPANIFWGLTVLQEVDMSYSILTTLPERIFENLISLQRFTCNCCDNLQIRSNL